MRPRAAFAGANRFHIGDPLAMWRSGSERSCDSVSTNSDATRRKVNVHSRTAVGLATSLKYSGDLDAERLVSRFSCTWHTAERRDWEAVVRTSKSMSTRLCSRRKRMNSSRSSDVSAPVPPFPASILARRTQSRSAFSPMLRSLAMRRDRAIPDLAEPRSLCFELGRE